MLQIPQQTVLILILPFWAEENMKLLNVSLQKKLNSALYYEVNVVFLLVCFRCSTWPRFSLQLGPYQCTEI